VPQCSACPRLCFGAVLKSELRAVVLHCVFGMFVHAHCGCCTADVQIARYSTEFIMCCFICMLYTSLPCGQTIISGHNIDTGLVKHALQVGTYAVKMFSVHQLRQPYRPQTIVQFLAAQHS